MTWGWIQSRYIIYMPEILKKKDFIIKERKSIKK